MFEKGAVVLLLAMWIGYKIYKIWESEGDRKDLLKRCLRHEDYGTQTHTLFEQVGVDTRLREVLFISRMNLVLLIGLAAYQLFF